MTGPGPFDPILFDLDGTVIDSVRLIRESHRHAVQTVLGHSLPDAELVANVGRPLLDQMVEFSPDHAQELASVFRTWNLANTERLLTAYEGMDDLLASLVEAGHELGIVTSKNRIAVDRAFAILDLRPRFATVVLAEDSEVHKPDPTPIRIALERLASGENATPCYVGDAPFDIAAGRAAGVATIGVTWGFFDRAALDGAGADHVVDSIAELREVLIP